MSSPGTPEDISRRKAEHLEICIQSDDYEVEGGSTMMDHVQLVHRALPEIDAPDIDTSTEFLGSRVRLPVFISSMTGGSTEAFKANKDLARVAQEARIPVGMGSIRILFRNPEVMEHFQLKKIARDVPVFANIGGVQLRDRRYDDLVELIRRLEVDAIAVHLNPGQELAQPEGDRLFSGIRDGIAGLCDASPVPVIVKETGFGIGPDEARALIGNGARYVDVAGGGGTNWMTVEGYRLSPSRKHAVDEFSDWGIPTAALLLATRTLEDRVLASGGMRTGMDVARALALGAVSVGMALPFIKAVATDGVDGAMALLEHLEYVLRTAMLLTGSGTVAELRRAPVLTSPQLARLADDLTALERV